MNRYALLLAFTLAGCPYDPEAAGLVAVDGGYVYGDGDAQVFLPTAVDGGFYGPDILPSPPTRETLCKLYIGDYTDMTQYPHRFGTWIVDAKRFFGPPPRNGQTLGDTDAKLSYLWSGDDDEPAGITLSFEYVALNVEANGGGAWSNRHLENSYFLNGIQLRGGDFLDCWRWLINEPGRTPCPDCIDHRYLLDCVKNNPKPQECFDPNNPKFRTGEKFRDEIP